MPVCRIADLVSGDVIVQILNALVLKARAYAQQVAPAVGERLERQA